MNQVCLSVPTRPHCTQCGGKPKNKSESHQTLSVCVCVNMHRKRKRKKHLLLFLFVVVFQAKKNVTLFCVLFISIQQTIVNEWNRDGRWQDVEDVFRAAAHDTECPELVREGKGCNFLFHLKIWKLYFSISFRY